MTHDPPNNDNETATKRNKKKNKIESWWRTTEWDSSWIGKIASIINSITPHNVGCERLFSVLRWICSKRHSRLSVDRMQTMAKLHTYYVSNASKEIMHFQALHRMIF